VPAAKKYELKRHAAVLHRIIGALFILDGLSLLLRGVVGGLFHFHESPSTGFVIAFFLHTIAGGAVYAFFGYSQLRDHSWVLGPLGFIVAATAVVWSLPSLGADYFTAILGGAALLELSARRIGR
jgi:hypothetical membrane protein